MAEYVTIQGDMWDAIAFKTLGSEAYTPALIQANPIHGKTVIFSAGVVLTLPETTPTVSAKLPPWKRGRML